jgi:hypothetical protein
MVVPPAQYAARPRADSPTTTGRLIAVSGSRAVRFRLGTAFLETDYGSSAYTLNLLGQKVDIS